MLPVNVKREFLFVVLAVRMGVIDTERLEELARQLDESSGQRLIEMLREQSILTAQQQADIEREIDRLLLADSTSVGKDTAVPSKTQRGSNEETIDTPSPGTMEESDDATRPSEGAIGEGGEDSDLFETLESLPRTRNRYRLTREHGRGGLGCVWLARDSILNREVALKEVLPGKRQTKNRYKKLIREAQITGQLEHPNIVPVYELSPNQEDQPFYTMRFLRGKTLGDHLRSANRRRPPAEIDALELRTLLGIFVSICHGIGYAHSRRIIHRDLKPSNIMLGDFGEVIVVDWGLAKKLDEAPREDVDMDAVVFDDEHSVSFTREGQALGTPAYMSPEQASGRVSLNDELTDIYGLGAILFAMLTGKSPHETTRPADTKDTAHDLLRRIRVFPTPTVRSVVPTAPRALDAICAKAMARSRSERYQSAEALAGDIQCWLADEPVSAYQDTALERASRWFRHHRTLSLAMAGVLLVASVAGFTIAAVTTNAKNHVAESLWKEQQARVLATESLEAEQAAKKLALQQFRRAQDAIDRSLSGVSEVLAVFPATSAVRAGLLQSAAEDYEELLQIDADDPQLRREAARTRIRLADLRRTMHEHDAADGHYQIAEKNLELLKQQHPDDTSWNIDLANVWVRRALLSMSIGDAGKAEQYFQQAVSAFDLPHSDPDLQRDAQIDLAGAQYNYAELLVQVDRIGEAAEMFAAAEAGFARVRDEAPDNLRAREGLAMCGREIGQLLQVTGDDQQAVERLRDAESEFKRLIAQAPDQISYREGLALTRVLLGNSLRLSGDDDGPLDAYQSSVEDYLVLLNQRPGMPKYRQSVATGRVNIAQMLHLSSRSRDAKVHLDQAVSELISLSQTYPQVAVYREAKAQCLVMLAMVLRDLNEHGMAETAFTGGIEEFTWLSEDFPELIRYRGDVAISRMGLAKTKSLQGKTAEARALLSEVIDELTDVVDAGKTQVRYRDALAWCHFYLAELLAAEDKLIAALPHYRQTLRLREQLPDSPKYRRALIRVLTECSAEQIRDPQRAIQLARELRDQDELNPDFRYSLAVAYLADGDANQALDEAEAAVQLRVQPSPFDLFVLAIALQQTANTERASVTLGKAIELMESQCPGRIELLTLRRRAEQAITGPDDQAAPPR